MMCNSLIMRLKMLSESSSTLFSVQAPEQCCRYAAVKELQANSHSQSFASCRVSLLISTTTARLHIYPRAQTLIYMSTYIHTLNFLNHQHPNIVQQRSTAAGSASVDRC